MLTVVLTLIAGVIFPASVFHAAPATAAEADTKNIFIYDFYDGYYNYGDYYEINYGIKIYKDTAAAINAKYEDGINKVFDSIEQFFYAYENLFFDKTSASLRRYKDVKAYNSSTNPYYIFDMCVYFAGDEKMSAGEKYREYFKFGGSGESLKPKKTFFANRYEQIMQTHFYLHEGMPEYGAFRSSDYNLEAKDGVAGIGQLASLNEIMMPFLLYGNVNNTGFADKPDAKISYKGLVNLFPDYFDGRDTGTREKMFGNYDLFHSYSCSTTYIKSDADDKPRGSGEYSHFWYISYANDKYRPNRDIKITYVQPNTINLYFFAIIITAGFIGLMVLLLYVLPRYTKKEGYMKKEGKTVSTTNIHIETLNAKKVAENLHFEHNEAPPPPPVFCKFCGGKNNGKATNCIHCGVAFSQDTNGDIVNAEQ